MRGFWDRDNSVGMEIGTAVGVDGGLKEVGADGEPESLEIEVVWDGSDVNTDEVHI